MQIIALMAQKGGCGKSTIAVNLGGAALEAGRNPLIIDIDMQASACKWADRREEESSLPVIDAQPSRLTGAIEKAASMGFDLILIDTPAKSGDAGLAAARVADLVIIPYRPQILDLETIDSSKDILRLAGDVPALAILNAAPPTGFKRKDDAFGFLKQYEIPISPHVISNRAVFGDAMAAGKTVIEYEPDGKGAQEIREVYKHISQLLDKSLRRKEGAAHDEGQSRRVS